MSTVVNSEREDRQQPPGFSMPGVWHLGQRDPSRPAIVIEGKTTTFGELVSKVNQLSNKFADLGLTRGDVVAGLLLNGTEYYELSLACTQSGLYFVPINTHLAGPEVEYIVRDCKASVLVVHAELADKIVGRVEDAVQHRVVIGNAPADWSSYESFTLFSDDTPAARSLGSLMMYTSGTTGRPKGVHRPLTDATPESALEPNRLFFEAVGIPAGPGRHLVCSPVYHAAPGSVSLSLLHAGHTLYVLPGFDAEKVLRMISDSAITTSHMVPTHFQRLLDLPADVRNSCDISSVDVLFHAGAPCPPATKRATIDWFGPVLIEYLGSTEGLVCVCSTAEWLEHPGTVGRPRPDTVVLRGLDGEQAASGEEGTIYFKASPFEYLGDPEKTAAAQWGDFITSGDVGRFDEDGYLYILDRRVDLILSGGVNVYPAEVEGALLEHPGVADVGVIGVSDPEWGQRVVAVVELASGFNDNEDLRTKLDQHVREQIAGFKRPREYIFVVDFPRSAAGKVSRQKLRELANGQ
ncbi:AMP-binding protein [Rhodococcus globerulus]|uniref:AMP-binding protein n=1 Tax=Rhodococcus globerulus TaxID=33008 RepID=UPI000AA1DD76|nr:AMP-binding protein [Rhodococcus globerulus]